MPGKKVKTAVREAQLISPDRLGELPLRRYASETDKSARGKLLIVAGSRRLPGAAVLASRAAMRVGVGNVRLAAVERIAVEIGIQIPELMVIPLPETPDGTIALAALPLLERQYESCHAMVIGPGLDESAETDELSRRVVATSPLPTLVDAHALLAVGTARAQERGRRGGRRAGGTGGTGGAGGVASAGAPPGPRVYTPHLEEMSALTGTPAAAIERDRQGTAAAFVQETGATLVLKGRETLIAAPDGASFVNTAGSRALGTAGSGDTLAGIIGGLLAQRMEPSHAAAWGVYLHALAGEEVARAYGEDGGMASDFVDRLPTVLRYLRTRALEHAR